MAKKTAPAKKAEAVSSVLEPMEFTFQIQTKEGPQEVRYILQDPAALSKVLAIVQTYGEKITE